MNFRFGLIAISNHRRKSSRIINGINFSQDGSWKWEPVEQVSSTLSSWNKKRRGREEGRGKKRVNSVLIGSLIEPFSGWTVVLLVCMCLQLQDVATNTHFRELLSTFNAHSGFPRFWMVSMRR